MENAYVEIPISINLLLDLVAIQILWATSLALVKLTILSFYMTIFGTRPLFRPTAYSIMGIIILWRFSFILCGFFLYQPFAFNWYQSIEGGSCGDQVKSYIVTGPLYICTDIMVLALPFPILWKLQSPLSNKLLFMGVFPMGFFVCMISVLLMKVLLTVDYIDITYFIVSALIWSMLEPALGITLACAPIIRPAFGFLVGKNSKSRSKVSDNIEKNLNSRRESKNFQKIQEEIDD